MKYQTNINLKEIIKTGKPSHISAVNAIKQSKIFMILIVFTRTVLLI